MAKKMWDVPLIVQKANPICWMACAAMVLSWKRNITVGIDQVIGSHGLDISNTSIPNLATFHDAELSLGRNGFSLERRATPDADYVASLLERGPFILLHFQQGFPYHFGRPGGTVRPTDTHAIVITGADTNGFEGQGRCWFNNPWGTRNSSCYIHDVVNAMKKLPSPNNPVAYL